MALPCKIRLLIKRYGMDKLDTIANGSHLYLILNVPNGYSVDRKAELSY